MWTCISEKQFHQFFVVPSHSTTKPHLMTSQQCLYISPWNKHQNTHIVSHHVLQKTTRFTNTQNTNSSRNTTLNPEPRQSKPGFTTCSHIYLVWGKLNPLSNTQTHPASNLKQQQKQTTQTDITMDRWTNYALMKRHTWIVFTVFKTLFQNWTMWTVDNTKPYWQNSNKCTVRIHSNRAQLKKNQ